MTGATLLKRIHQQLEDLSKTARRVPLEAGMGPDVIRDSLLALTSRGCDLTFIQF